MAPASEPSRVMEAQLTEAIARILARYHRLIARAIVDGKGWSAILRELENALRAQLLPMMLAAVMAEMQRQSEETGISFETGRVADEALSWLGYYSIVLARQLSSTTSRVVRRAQDEYLRTPGMTIGLLLGLLLPAFGAMRSEVIAITELTRATSAGANITERMMTELGVKMQRRWNTANDERVCPVCFPLHRQLENVWRNEFPDGPPGHSRCRCWLSLVSET